MIRDKILFKYEITVLFNSTEKQCQGGKDVSDSFNNDRITHKLFSYKII